MILWNNLIGNRTIEYNNTKSNIKSLLMKVRYFLMILKIMNNKVNLMK